MTHRSIATTFLIILLSAGPLVGCSESHSFEQYLSEGRRALDHGDLSVAVINFKSALQIAPDDPAARWLLGRAFLRQGNYVSATRELERAQQLGISNSDLLRDLATALLGEGVYEKLDALAVGNDLSPVVRASVLATQAESLLARERILAAEEKAASALALDAASNEGRLAMAHVESELGRFTEARERVKSVLEDAPDRADGWLLMAAIERSSGQLDAAESALTKAMADPAQSLRAQLTRALVRLQAGSLDAAEEDLKALRAKLKESPQLDYADGLLAYLRQDYRSARSYLDAALGKLPAEGASLALAGSNQLALGEPAMARIYLERAVSARPDEITTRRMLGMTLLQLGELEEAEALARQLLAQLPNDAASMDLLASALMMQGKRDEGLAVLRQVRQAIISSPAEAVRAGAALLAQGSNAAGLDQLKAALTEDPALQTASAQGVLKALRAGDLEEAGSLADAYRKESSDGPAALALTGLVSLARGESDAALQDFNAALDKDPGRLAAAVGVAELAAQTGDLERARHVLESSLAYHPESDARLAQLARIALAMGDGEAARGYVEQALASGPKAVDAILEVGAQELRLGSPAQTLRLLALLDDDAAAKPGALRLTASAQLALADYGAARATLLRLGDAVNEEPGLLVSLASASAELGKLDEANASLEKALDLDPEYLPARLGLTKLAVARKDIAAAERGLRGLRERLGASDREVLLIEAQIADLRGNLTAANQAFQELLGGTGKALAIDLGLQGAAEQLILGYVRDGNPQRALEAAQALRDRQPNAPGVHLLLGTLYQREGQTELAAQSFGRALALEPGSPAATRGLAEIAITQGDLDEAQRLYEASLERHPVDVDLLVGLARLALLRDDPLAAQASLNQAVQGNPLLLTPRLYLAAYWLRQDNAARALSLLDEARTIHGDDPGLLGLEAEAQLKLERYEAAAKTLRQLERLRPDDPQILVALAGAQAGLGDEAGAERALERALRLQPDSVAALNGLARLAILKKAVDEAEARIDALKRIVGADSQDVMVLEGNLAEAQDDLGRAGEIYGKLFKQSPSSVSLLWMARVKVKSQDIEGAWRDMTAWLDKHPNDGLVHFEVGMLYMNVGKQKEAAEHYERSLALGGANPIALNNLAWLLREEQPDKALEYGRQAHAISPDSADIADTLAVLLGEQGQLAEAQRLVEEAHQKAPENASILFHKASILARAGAPDQAIKALQTALALDQGFAERAAAESLLARLRAQ
nr:XrtA/PEP-CTERM system TPR-repeat protein PrsT [Thiorhodococcus drewsii]